MQRSQISRPINFNLFNAVGMYSIGVALNSCLNIPADQISNQSSDCLMEIFTHNLIGTVRTQILIVPVVTGYIKYERTLTNTSGAVNYAGGSDGGPWRRVFYQGDSYASNFTPDITASKNIGAANLTWNNIYTQNAVTVVSDERYKTDISALNDQELVCAIACSKLYKKYKLNAAVDEKGAKAARYHIGAIAQEIVQCFVEHKLDWRKYGIVTYENWDAIEAVEYQAATYNENDQELTAEIQAVEGREAGEIYMLRYEEFNCFVNAGLEYRLAQLEAKLTD